MTGQKFREEDGREPTIFHQESAGRHFDVTYADINDPRVKTMFPPPCDASLCELLQGFFNFYDSEYDWGNEVVSIRLGQRCDLTENADVFTALGRKERKSKSYIHIEDPFDLERNLNCVLYYECACQLRNIFRLYAETAKNNIEEIVNVLCQSGRQMAAEYDAWFSQHNQDFYSNLSAQGSWDGLDPSSLPISVPPSVPPSQHSTLWPSPPPNPPRSPILGHRPPPPGGLNENMAIDADALLAKVSPLQLVEIVKRIKSNGTASEEMLAKLKGILFTRIIEELNSKPEAPAAQVLQKLQMMLQGKLSGGEQQDTAGTEKGRHMPPSQKVPSRGFYWEVSHGESPSWQVVDQW